MPPVEPLWLTVADLIDINADEVSATGEPHGLRDRGLLESAAARPSHLFHYNGEEDVVVLAVSLLYGITQNHPFIQGNKRTGFTGALVFMEVNGYRWVGEDDPDHWATLVVQVQQQIKPEGYLADAMRLFVVSAG